MQRRSLFDLSYGTWLDSICSAVSVHIAVPVSYQNVFCACVCIYHVRCVSESVLDRLFLSGAWLRNVSAWAGLMTHICWAGQMGQVWSHNNSFTTAQQQLAGLEWTSYISNNTLCLWSRVQYFGHSYFLQFLSIPSYLFTILRGIIQTDASKHNLWICNAAKNCNLILYDVAKIAALVLIFYLVLILLPW